MKKYLIILIAAFLFAQTQSFAQTDSRNRTPETVIADALAQMPAKDSESFKQLMGEMAATGSAGILQIASTMNFEGNNTSAGEYALGGLQSYITTPDGQKYRDEMRKGLKLAIDKTDNLRKKVYLITVLTGCATTADLPDFIRYAQNKDLRDAALAFIGSIKGSEKEKADFVRTSDAEPILLAKIIKSCNLTNCNDLLVSWLSGADAVTTAAIYDAMAAVAPADNLALLAEAAQSAGYKPESTHATDAYIAMLDRICNDNKEIVEKEAKKLMKSETPAMRCAGLRLMLKAEGPKGISTFTKALRDRDAEYRNTALEYGLEYCGPTALDAMVKAMSRLSYDGQTDVVRWIGNYNATNYTDVVLKKLKKSSGTLLSESIITAAKLGGEQSLEALIALLGTQNAEEAKNALYFFNGDLREAMVQALNSDDKKVVTNALQVVSKRGIRNAFDKVLALTSSDDKDISAAALEALGHVAGPDELDRLFAMLDKADEESAAKLQDAIITINYKSAPEKAFEMTKKAMDASAKPARYYRILASTNTDEAIQILQKAGNTEAQAALLDVKNIKMLPILLDMAKDKRKGEAKDKILSRYLDLASTADATPVERYLMLVAGMESGASESLGNRFLKAIGQTQTLQALGYMRKYYDTSEYADVAAECIKDIVAAHDDFNGGRHVKEMLEQGIATYIRQVDNHDAGYAVDQIKGLLAKRTPKGYSLSTGRTKMNRRGYWKMKESFENFNLSFDWKSGDNLEVSLRDMSVLTFDKEKGVKLYGENQQWHPYSNVGEWNSADIKVVDDRVFVSVNGKELITNAVITNPKEGKSLNAVGGIGFQAANDSLIVRYTRIRKLPSTPVFQLSTDEKKEGFEVLFDGRSLDKWQGNTTNYVPQNGNIYVSANYGGSGNLYTKKKYSDFVLRFDFCFDTPGVNNGVGVRTNLGTDAAYDGMEIQILDHDDPIYNGLMPYQQHGAVYGIIVPEHVKFDKVGTWYSEEIRVVGDRVKVTVNGKVILDGDIRKACKGHNVAPDGSEHNPYTVDNKNHPGLFNKEGYISFCGHGPGIMFRNVRILDLSKKSKRR